MKVQICLRRRLLRSLRGVLLLIHEELEFLLIQCLLLLLLFHGLLNGVLVRQHLLVELF